MIDSLSDKTLAVLAMLQANFDAVEDPYTRVVSNRFEDGIDWGINGWSTYFREFADLMLVLGIDRVCAAMPKYGSQIYFNKAENPKPFFQEFFRKHIKGFVIEENLREELEDLLATKEARHAQLAFYRRVYERQGLALRRLLSRKTFAIRDLAWFYQMGGEPKVSVYKRAEAEKAIKGTWRDDIITWIRTHYSTTDRYCALKNAEMLDNDGYTPHEALLLYLTYQRCRSYHSQAALAKYNRAFVVITGQGWVNGRKLTLLLPQE